MIIIRINKKTIMGMDDAWILVEMTVNEPETPIFPLSSHYPAAVKVESDGEFYKVYGPGDV